MKRKMICFFAALCLVFCGTTAVATNGTSSSDVEEVIPRYEKIASMSAHLTISNAGYATCSGMVSLRPGYNVKATISLQKLENGSWNEIKSWVHNGSGVLGVNESDGYWVEHGTYIVELTAYVTDSAGGYIESPSALSSVVFY